MGAQAGEAYLQIGLPPDFADADVLDLVDGADKLAAEVGVTICGGDLTRSGTLFVAVTVVGHAASEQELAGRSGARPGDSVGVSGTLGGAGVGLLALERSLPELSGRTLECVLDRYLRPVPRLALGRELAQAGVSAMVDVSDGIASDCKRIAERSRVAIDVHLDSLPIDTGVEEAASALEIPASELAASAGEDYELLFTAPAERVTTIESAARSCEVPVTWIGEVREGEEVRLLDEAGTSHDIVGWDHLATDPGADDR
jgi:thiamine-monophosphate kinase